MVRAMAMNPDAPARAASFALVMGVGGERGGAGLAEVRASRQL